jgi:multiple sugar transport system ATP-binding protein
VSKVVAIGVRSEDMEDASLRTGIPADRVLLGEVTLVEALGSEIVVHFNLAGDKVETEDTKLLAKESGEAELGAGEGMVRWVASFAPRSRVRMGEQVQIAIDVERVHFFDPGTGEALR